MIFVVLIVTLVLWALVKYFLHIKHMESYVKDLNTIHPLIPFLGNSFFMTSKSLSEIIQKHFEFALKNGKPFKTIVGHVYNISLHNPEDAKTILMSPYCLDKPNLYDFYPCPSGIIFQQSSAAWKPVRKLMNPMFNLKILQSFLPIFNDVTIKMIDDLESEVGGPAFDMLNYANICTLDSICSSVLGLEIDLKSNKGKEFIHSMHTIFDESMLRVVKPFTRLNPFKDDQKHLRNIRHFTKRVFDEKLKSYLASRNNSELENQSRKPELSIIPMLIEGTLSEEMVQQQIETLLMAGFETTASTISFAVLMLAIHSHIQEECVAELRSVYNSKEEDTTYDHIQKLILLERVLKETMRLFPIGGTIARKSSKDIASTDCVIPKDTQISILIAPMHRRRDIWGENSDVFNPDHFLPENVEKRHPFAFLPFSGGPRNCIGYQYAMFSLKVMLSAILRHYKLSTHLKMNDLELKYGVIIAHKHCHRVFFYRGERF